MSDFTSYAHTRSQCPQCDYVTTHSSVLHGNQIRPQPGDMTLCLNCGAVLSYADDLALRKSTREEIAEIMRDARAWSTIEEAQRFIAERGPLPKGGDAA